MQLSFTQNSSFQVLLTLFNPNCTLENKAEMTMVL